MGNIVIVTGCFPTKGGRVAPGAGGHDAEPYGSIHIRTCTLHVLPFQCYDPQITRTYPKLRRTCICTYIYTHIYIHTCKHLSVCLSVCMYACMHACRHTDPCIYVYIQKFNFKYIYETHTKLNTNIYIHIYTHTYMYRYIYANVETCAYVRSSQRAAIKLSLPAGIRFRLDFCGHSRDGA